MELAVGGAGRQWVELAVRGAGSGAAGTVAATTLALLRVRWALTSP